MFCCGIFVKCKLSLLKVILHCEFLILFSFLCNFIILLTESKHVKCYSSNCFEICRLSQVDDSVVVSAEMEKQQSGLQQRDLGFPKFEVTAKDANNQGITVRHVRFILLVI